MKEGPLRDDQTAIERFEAGEGGEKVLTRAVRKERFFQMCPRGLGKKKGKGQEGGGNKGASSTISKKRRTAS